MEEMLEVVFPVRSVPRLYRKAVCSESEYEVGMRWSPACEDVSPEAEERPPLEAYTKQLDWEHWSVCNSDLWGVVTGCISAQ
jgi:hypothetical protein